MKNWIKTRIVKLITFIGLSSFTTKDGSRFRVTGYYYAYNLKDGERKLVRCHKLFANCISGYGACGWIIPFHEVAKIGFKFKRWHFFKESLRTERFYIKREKAQFRFLRSMPKNLTESEYREIAIKMAVNSAMKSFKKQS